MNKVDHVLVLSMNLRRICIVYCVVVRDLPHYKACHFGRKLVSEGDSLDGVARWLNC